jgi:hypothetical protein
MTVPIKARSAATSSTLDFAENLKIDFNTLTSTGVFKTTNGPIQDAADTRGESQLVLVEFEIACNVWYPHHKHWCS